MDEFALEEYLSNGVDRIVKNIIRATFQNPRESAFMVKHKKESKAARQIREAAEKTGEHIPPFLIASITKQCNLHCRGCYARANQSCVDHSGDTGVLTDDQWGSVFSQAEELGIEFILLAGGEPFVRPEVLKTAGLHRKIIFPIFTNGTMLQMENMSLIQKNPNLIPIISIEGNESITDERRGTGIYQKIKQAMTECKKKEIVFGSSVTVTKKNIKEVYSKQFIEELEAHGAKAIIYVEYVPVDGETIDLAPDQDDRAYAAKRLNELRSHTEMVLIAFPGDEKSSGGCLAAGRGFFHINALGGAEPCPFSPYSDTNLKNTSLKAALHSPLFQKLQTHGCLTNEHIGGCVLFEQKELVEDMLTVRNKK